ncbi:hypothetical protein ZWY2020_018386 [Hordeum vulgare]|nr:hypothetical protein ZWY2020_018386 [Hordeum vulgare]
MPTSEPSAAAAAGAGGDAASQRAAVEPVHLPTPEEFKGQEMMNNCAVRSVLSYKYRAIGIQRDVQKIARLAFIEGGGLGVLMGLFFGALENPIMAEEMTARQQIVYQAKQMGRKSMSHAKTFAVMGLIFSAAECVVEVAGCVTGGALAAKGGPQAKCIGCVCFGAFSVFEKFMDRHT